MLAKGQRQRSATLRHTVTSVAVGGSLCRTTPRPKGQRQRSATLRHRDLRRGRWKSVPDYPEAGLASPIGPQARLWLAELLHSFAREVRAQLFSPPRPRAQQESERADGRRQRSFSRCAMRGPRMRAPGTFDPKLQKIRRAGHMRTAVARKRKSVHKSGCPVQQNYMLDIG